MDLPSKVALDLSGLGGAGGGAAQSPMIMNLERLVSGMSGGRKERKRMTVSGLPYFSVSVFLHGRAAEVGRTRQGIGCVGLHAGGAGAVGVSGLHCLFLVTGEGVSLSVFVSQPFLCWQG